MDLKRPYVRDHVMSCCQGQVRRFQGSHSSHPRGPLLASPANMRQCAISAVPIALNSKLQTNPVGGQRASLNGFHHCEANWSRIERMHLSDSGKDRGSDSTVASTRLLHKLHAPARTVSSVVRRWTMKHWPRWPKTRQEAKSIGLLSVRSIMSQLLIPNIA